MLDKFIRNWTFHNLISHPLSELIFLITRNKDLAAKVHDMSIPDHSSRL